MLIRYGYEMTFVCSAPTPMVCQLREDEGTQSPMQTLDRGWGSCRDFAVLFVEAARSLGFGARLVSGYLFNPDQMHVGSTDAGSTHAWADVFVSGAEWISFDPTNRSIGGANLIPVAVARDIRQAAPVSGAYAGNSDALESMSVEVLVTSSAAPAWRQPSEQSSRVGAAHGQADRFSAGPNAAALARDGRFG